MKYVIIIPDGAADFALDDLDGRTPFEAAKKPNIDGLCQAGRQGTAVTTPQGMPCGSDVCSMSLLGYDPATYHSGRAPLEAAALGIDLQPTDWIFRMNLVTVIDGAMQDHSAGHITSEEGRALLAYFAEHMELSDMTLYPGVSYRNIMIDSSNASGTGRNWSDLKSTPPHDVPGEPIRRHLPSGCDDAALLQQMIAESEAMFARHDINETRREAGQLPATHLWPWGQGTVPSMPSFADRFDLRGAMITAVDLLAGIAHFIGWDRLDVPGQTSYHDNDYEATGKYAIAALEKYDLVCVHVEAPDEASHAADAKTKVAAIEAIDRHVVGPIAKALHNRDEPWRLLYMPDHYTRVDNRKHDPTPVPFVITGHRIGTVLQRPFTEANATASDLHVEFGHELMEYFLRSSLK